MRAAPSAARVTGPVAPPMSRAVLRERLPGYVGQAVLLAVVAWLAWRGIANFEANARALGLSAGFGFLRTQAGFEIAQALIPFSPQSSYLDAVVVATLNTLLVVALAGILSTIAGLCVAFGRVASPGLVRGAASAYVEVFRNIPLLLQILFWYASAIVLLPGVGDTLQFGSVLLNNRGLFLPSIHLDTAGACSTPRRTTRPMRKGVRCRSRRRSATRSPGSTRNGLPSGTGAPDAFTGDSIVGCRVKRGVPDECSNSAFDFRVVADAFRPAVACRRFDAQVQAHVRAR